MSMKKIFALAVISSVAVAAIPAYANPFSDVPMNHWAYDAVETLAAKGILEGYPDDTFRGKKAMSRYEIASMVARLMASDNVGNEDIEQLKALIAEFGPELESLGVKIDGFDSRLAALEKGMGGWRISGELQFDYNSVSDSIERVTDLRDGFEFDSARLFLHRNLSNGVSFDAEWGDDTFDRFYLTAENFLGVKGLTARIGQFDIDFEGDDELYYGEHEDAGFFMGLPYRGAQLTKDFGLGELTVFAASNVGDDGISVYDSNDSEDIYGARLKLNFGEKTWFSANALFVSTEDKSSVYITDSNYDVYWFALGYKIINGVELKGAYYIMDIDEAWGSPQKVDDPSAYKIILDVDQEALKFTSLWAEYAHMDEGFLSDNTPYAFHASFMDAVDNLSYNLVDFTAEVDVLFLALKQEWGKKFSTFERYVQYDFDSNEWDDVIDWAVGVGFQYSPDLYFELAYNCIDIGDNVPAGYDDDGHFIRFRTLLSF